MKFRPSIRFRLFIAFLCLLLAIFGVLFYHTVRTLDASLEEIIEAELETDLRFAWQEYFSVAEHFRYSLLQPATSPQILEHIRRRNTRELTDFVIRHRKNLESAHLLLVVDNGGRIIAGTGAAGSGERSGFSTFITKALHGREPMIATEAVSPVDLCAEEQRQLGIHPVAAASATKLLIQTMVMPVSTDEGEIIGGIVAGGVVNRRSHLPLQIRKILGSDVELSITQGAERIVSSQDERNPVVISPTIMKKLEEGLSYRGQARLGQKEMFLAAFQPLADSYGRTVGTLSVALSLDSYYKIRNNHLRSMGLAAVLGVLFSFAVSWFAARQLTKPLRALARSTIKIREGDLTQQVEVHSGGELGELEESFNAMTDALRQRDDTIQGQNEQLRIFNRELEDRVTVRTAELHREKSRLEAILTSMAEGLIVVDRENLVVLLNPSAQKLFEAIPSRMIGKPLETLCESESFLLLLNYLRSIEDRVSQISVVEERVHACGKELIFRVSPLLNDNGDYAGMVLAVRDITAEADMERMKGEFYSAVSHEFKTPLTSMKGSLELLLGSKLLTEVREQSLMQICLRNTERLIELTGEILDIARIGAGNVTFIMETVRMAEVLEGVLAEIGDSLRRRGIRLIDHLDPSLPSVFGDRTRLIKVFSNLIANAVYASPDDGAVTVSSAKSGNYLQVSIVDQGTGVNRPGRLSSWDSDEVAGTGLGLSLCLEIIREHHGRIEYLAGQDGGTMVRVTLPLGEEQEDAG